MWSALRYFFGMHRYLLEVVRPTPAGGGNWLGIHHTGNMYTASTCLVRRGGMAHCTKQQLFVHARVPLCKVQPCAGGGEGATGAGGNSTAGGLTTTRSRPLAIPHCAWLPPPQFSHWPLGAAAQACFYLCRLI